MDVIVNWLWQGSIVAFAAAAALRAIPHSRTEARYWFVWTTCVVVLALPAVPFIVAVLSPAPLTETTAVTLGPVVSIPRTWWTSAALATGLWTGWFAVCAYRLLSAIVALRRTRGQCRECPDGLDVRLLHWSRVRATGRRTRLVLSTSVRSAAVLGGGSPVIALAPALLERLSDADLDRVVIHEWAHVQRRDDLALLAQRLVRAMAGWHPAVLWVERQLAIEREVACDDIAVGVTGSAKEYATCLATLGTLPIGPSDSWPVLAAVSSSGLHRRILRILSSRGARPWRALAFCAGVPIATFALAVGSVQVVESGLTLERLPTVTVPMLATAIATHDSSRTDPVAPAAASSNRATPRTFDASPRRIATATAAPTEIAEPPVVAVSVPPLESVQSLQPPLDVPLVTEAATRTAQVAPVTSSMEDRSVALATERPPVAETQVPTPWAAAATAGVAIARGSRNTGVATAGFFSRFSKKLAGSF